MRAQNAKRADPVNRSVNNLRLTLNMSGLTTLCNRLRLRLDLEPEATISKDYIKHKLIRLIYIIVENTILEPYFHNI